MKGNIQIPVTNHMVNIMPPTAAGNNSSDVFSMTEDAHVDILINTGAVTNATTITVNECTDSDGTSATAIAFNYYKTSTAASDTWGARTAATSGGISTGTTNNLMWCISLDASELSDGYEYVRVDFSTAGTIKFGALAVFGGGRYKSEQTAVSRID